MSERDGGDLHLTIVLQARAASSDQPGGHWEQYLGEAPLTVPRSHWIEQLNQSKAARLLLLEVRLADGDIRHPADRHLLRTQELFAAGDWRGCVSECRQFAEELGSGKLVSAMDTSAHPKGRSRECPENGGMTRREVRSVGSKADRGNGDAMGVAVDYDGG